MNRSVMGIIVRHLKRGRICLILEAIYKITIEWARINLEAKPSIIKSHHLTSSSDTFPQIRTVVICVGSICRIGMQVDRTRISLSQSSCYCPSAQSDVLSGFPLCTSENGKTVSVEMTFFVFLFCSYHDIPHGRQHRDAV